MKKVRLTPKEVARADSGYTVVVRPQSGKGFMVAVVKVDGQEGELLDRPFTRYVDDQSQVAAAAKDVVRMLSKMGVPGDMGDATRERWKPHHMSYSYDRKAATPGDPNVLLVKQALSALAHFQAAAEAPEKELISLFEGLEKVNPRAAARIDNAIDAFAKARGELGRAKVYLEHPSVKLAAYPDGHPALKKMGEDLETALASVKAGLKVLKASPHAKRNDGSVVPTAIKDLTTTLKALERVADPNTSPFIWDVLEP